MNDRILFIDDDENILASFKRNLRRDFDIETAASPEEGLSMLKISSQHPFSVVVSDLKMPKISGIDVLRSAKRISPNTVRIMLTGYADIDTAVNAVNEGNIFRFLTKPCSVELLKQTLKTCAEQYRLVMAEKELLRDTLQGSVKMLVNVLSMHSPEVFGRSENVKKLVGNLISKVKVEQQWQLEVASMLVYLGYIALPADILKKIINEKELTPAEMQIYRSYPENGAGLVANIPRLGGVAELIKKQRILSESDAKQPVSVRILNLAMEFLELEKQTGLHSALTTIKNKVNIYGIDLINALQETVGTRSGHVLRSLKISELREQMVLDEDVLTVDNLLLCKKGQELNDVIIMRLVNYGRSCGVKEPIKVLI
ncbi:MAG: HD domain-containing phosphohydrolase [Deferribacterales bacterium]